MKDDVLAQLRAKEQALIDRERSVQEELKEIRRCIRLREQQNADFGANVDTSTDYRFADYGNPRMKFRAIQELLTESPGLHEDALADRMVKHGLPLGRVRQRANALKSIREYVKHGRLTKSSSGELSVGSGSSGND